MFEDLYFIDVRKTVDLILENRLTDAIALKYLVTISILFGALIQVPIDYEESDGGIITVVLAISAFALKGFVSYKGVIACKAANDSADGLNFFRRFIVLSVPVGVAVAVAVDVTTVRVESGRSRARRLLRAVSSYLFCDRINRACFLIFFSSHTLAT